MYNLIIPQKKRCVIMADIEEQQNEEMIIELAGEAAEEETEEALITDSKLTPEEEIEFFLLVQILNINII